MDLGCGKEAETAKQLLCERLTLRSIRLRMRFGQHFRTPKGFKMHFINIIPLGNAYNRPSEA